VAGGGASLQAGAGLRFGGKLSAIYRQSRHRRNGEPSPLCRRPLVEQPALSIFISPRLCVSV